MDRSTLPSIMTMNLKRSPNKIRTPGAPPIQEKIILLRKYSELRSPVKRNTMSVTEPADSGSSQAASQILQVENISTLGSWAQMMEEEVFDPHQFDDDEEEGTDEVDGAVDSSMSPERRRHIPEEAPFRVQITNLDREQCQEELVYYFGGEKFVKRCDFQLDEGKAEFEFHARDGLLSALKKTDLLFKGRSLKVYVIRNQQQIPAKVSTRNSQDYRQYESQDSRRGHDGRYNSQNSLNSDRHFRNERGNFSNYRNNNNSQHYNTMPAGGYHGNRGNRGGYQHNGGYHNNDSRNSSFRAPRNPQFDRQHSHPKQYNNYNRSYDHQHGGGPLQRSGSDYQQNYRHQYNHYLHGSVRSRTESHSTNNQLDNFSRASSRLSVATNDEPAKVQKKQSANPFGDAKPVDTQSKLLEAEKRLTEKESQKSSEATGDHSQAEVSQVDQQAHHQKFPNYQHAGYHPRGGHYNHQNYQHQGHHQGGYHQYPRRHHNESQSEPHQVSPPNTFEQGAPPGSVVIKKRESVELEKQQKEDEIPPVDPIHHPLEPTNNDKKVSTGSSEQSDQLNKTLPPPHPHHSNNYRGNRNRPTMKPYAASRGGHHLQKSATVGAVMGQGDCEPVEQKPHGQGKRHQQGGARRASLSGSESGRGAPGGGENKSRGSKRGGRGGRGAGNIQRGGARRSEGGDNSIQEVENKPKEQQKDKENVENVKDEKKPETSELKKELPTVAEVKDTGAAPASSAEQNSTPKKKKESKKKKEKKEAKTLQLGTNKFAALLDAPQ